MGKLTAIEVKNLRQPGRYADGAGLYLFIDKRSGLKSWVLRATLNGKRRDLGMGGFPAVTLAEARRKAEATKGTKAEAAPAPKRRPVKENPKARKSTAPTFRQLARDYHAQASATWKNDKTSVNWIQRAEKYIFPAIGDTPIDEITRADVLRILQPVWTAKAETGRRLREILKHVFAWAMAFGHIQINPAGETINAALKAQPKCKAHHRALPASAVASAIETVDKSTSFQSTKLAFRFLVLTAARTSEVLGATWAEIDFAAATWTIPGSRMKEGKDHRVALSTGALAVLRQAEALRLDSPYIFPNERTPDKQLSNMVLSVLLKRLYVPAVPHGFRASFRTWADDSTDADYAVKEMALAHEVGNAVVQSYARSDLLERRRCLMQQWSDYLGIA